jgi:ribonuclease P protein component
MLSAKHRFHGYGSLRRVYGRSQGVRGNLVSLRYAKRDQARPYRVAVVVGKKVSKSAVTRNRIRRRLYELVRTSDLVPQSTDLVFTVYSDSLAELPSGELRSLVDDLLRKASQVSDSN